ncbi:latexin isoform X1 [Passer domesticus]|uniref:latexin isoform X1 n=1 Tax=Passer domesticus TaxID=48849 RepID=UPI0030FEB2B2
MRCPAALGPEPAPAAPPRPALPAGGGSGSRAMELPPSHLSAARAAAAAVGYLRYLRGGPGRGLQLRELRRARRQDIDDVGHKYYLDLELEDVLDKDTTVHCTAEVLYHLGSKSSAPDVQVTVQGELRSTEGADKEFYSRIRSLEKELVAENIPDSHGNVPPELEPIHLLAWVASGYVIWQNSTENTKFHLAQVKHVKQVKRSDEDLQFDFVVLLHEMVSQVNNFIPKKPFLGVLRLQLCELQLRHRSDPAG